MSKYLIAAWAVATIPAVASAAENLVDPATGMELVPVKGGCFMMGDAAGDGAFDTRPAHEVCVGDFAIGKLEVTQEQFAKVMEQNPSQNAGCDRCPVDSVSWDVAQTFLRKLAKAGGKKYRLPTEAEWEYACRSGGKTQKFCGGDVLEPLGWPDTGEGSTHPVGQKKPNQLGLFDMTGNVGEWVSDWYSEVFYWVSTRDNPVGPTSSWSVLQDNEPSRVLRGVRGAIDRAWDSPKAIGTHFGLRVALSTAVSPAARVPPIPGKPGKAQGVDVLPRGGGAPGEAFSAWEKAFADDMNHAFATLDRRSFVKKLLAMADAESGRPPSAVELTEEQVNAVYESARQQQPTKADTRIDGGIMKGELAILYSAKVRTGSGYNQTLVYMVLKGRAWTVLKSLSRWHS